MTDTAVNVLVLNSGSSSLKFGMYQANTATVRTLSANEAESPGGEIPVDRILAAIGEAGMQPQVVGHRIVHGGPQLRQPTLITETVLRQLDGARAFAPLHAAPALAGIRFAAKHFPGLPQVACFDTAFHAQLPDLARILPIARELRAEGIERYGFHGLSCESIVRQLGAALPDRLVIAHLGNGASITAVKRGRSIDTSMGLTPTGGVVMGTRSGDLDPGLLIYLMRTHHLDADQLERLIDRHSGLLGISGMSSDMRTLHDAAPKNGAARLAIDIFCYVVRKEIAAMIAALEGIDQLVFTGGIGEHDWRAREAICGGLQWTGIVMDEKRNQSGQRSINDPASACRVAVLPSRENEEIARHSAAVISAL